MLHNGFVLNFRKICNLSIVARLCIILQCVISYVSIMNLSINAPESTLFFIFIQSFINHYHHRVLYCSKLSRKKMRYNILWYLCFFYFVPSFPPIVQFFIEYCYYKVVIFSLKIQQRCDGMFFEFWILLIFQLCGKLFW